MNQSAQPFKVWWDDDAGVAALEWAPGSTVNLANATLATEAIRALGHGAVSLIVDIRGVKEFDREARSHFLQDQAGSGSTALLAGSAVNRMLANFFIGLNKVKIPMKMFTDRSAAYAWLSEHR